MRLLYLTDRLSNRGGADHHLMQVIASSVEAGREVMVAYGRNEGGVLARTSHQLSAAAGDAMHPTPFSHIGVLTSEPKAERRKPRSGASERLSSTSPRPSNRKQRWAQHLAGLATKPGEKYGLGLDGVEYHRIRGLSSMVESSSRLGELADLVVATDVVHIQNVMNPTALAMAVDGGGAVVTVQDHRVFCPGPGKTLVDGSACNTAMSETVCRDCVPEVGYRRATLELTSRRLAALRDAEIVVLSQYMADQLEVMGVAGARVILPWVEVGPDRTIPGSFFLLGGRLVAHKGILDGWRAWQEAEAPLPLVVAGSGPLESELLGTELRGWLTPEDLRATLRRARALIFPTRWQEPFGILGLEALAQGTPVVVADSGGTADWSTSGCIHVPAGNLAAMTAAIERLAADPEFALELGREGQSAVRDLFARERIEPKLGEMYYEIARS